MRTVCSTTFLTQVWRICMKTPTNQFNVEQAQQDPQNFLNNLSVIKYPKISIP